MPALDLRVGVLVAVVLSGVAALAWVGPIPQDLRYHLFADTRTVGGLHNFWNVISNLPFLMAAVLCIVYAVPTKTKGANVARHQ